MREAVLGLELRLAERFERTRIFQALIERAHELVAGPVIDLPEGGDHGWRPRVEKRPLQSHQLVAARQLAEARLTGREHDEPGLQVEPEDLAHLEPPVLTAAWHQEHRRGERIALV